MVKKNKSSLGEVGYGDALQLFKKYADIDDRKFLAGLLGASYTSLKSETSSTLLRSEFEQFESSSVGTKGEQREVVADLSEPSDLPILFEEMFGLHEDDFQQYEKVSDNIVSFQNSVESKQELQPSFWRVDERWQATEQKGLKKTHILTQNLPERVENESTISLKSIPFLPLEEWEHLWPRLQKALQGERYSHQPDERKCLKKISSGQPVTSIPFKKRKCWARYFELLLDCEKRNALFLQDYQWLVAQLIAMLGKDSVQEYRLLNGPMASAYIPSQKTYKIFERSSHKVPLLILSDLGAYGTSRDRKEWLAFGRNLVDSGQKPIVLTPVPSKLWDERFNAFFQLVEWSSFFVFNEKKQNDVYEPYSTAVETLLTLASPSIRVEPQLLRALRLEVYGADIATEALAWQRDDVVKASFTQFGFRAEIHNDYRTAFSNLPSVLQQRAFNIITAYHEQGYLSVFGEEQLTVYILKLRLEPDTPVPQSVKKFLRWLGHCFEQRSKEEFDAMASWLKRLSRQLPEDVDKVDGVECLERAALIAFKPEIDSGNTTRLPSFLTDRILEEAYGAEQYTWSLRQQEERIIITQIESSTSDNDLSLGQFQGSSFATINVGNKIQRVLLSKNYSIPLAGERSITLSTSTSSMTLVAEEKPFWAESIWRTTSGLYAKLQLDESKIQWVLPNEIQLLQYFPKSVHQAQNNIEKGSWVNLSHFFNIIKNNLPDVTWASAHGFDQYGLYADFSIENITQRMRWIHPGRFMMGSFEDEIGHISNEEQHEVTFTKGFWLADTTCTQELWEHVMGDNPSNYMSPLLPVDQVCWHDCNEFLNKLNGKSNQYNFSLPTEAQWEYACRAGTTTAYSFGNEISITYANYSATSTHGNKEKESTHAKTVSVDSYLPNQWGMYQMHGNVWEWCADRYTEYSGVAVSNPEASSVGNYHVLRGGCCIAHSRLIRSAYRHKDEPDARLAHFGFRFSRC